jgi:hypothetical protein
MLLINYVNSSVTLFHFSAPVLLVLAAKPLMPTTKPTQRPTRTPTAKPTGMHFVLS